MEHMVSVPSRARGLPVDITSAQRYLNISEAAAQLGVSRVTIWRWIRAGLLPGRRLGHRTVRIRAEDLDQLLAKGVSQIRPASDFELARPDHVVRFYENGEVLATAAGDFIGEALSAGEAAIVIAT